MYRTAPHTADDITIRPRELLGSGGMGQVWLAEGGVVAPSAPHNATLTAVKFLMGERAREARFVRLFRAEVQSHARMSHPGIVQILDTDVVGQGGLVLPNGEVVEAGSPYLVMEYVRGATLQALMGQLSWPQIRRILLELLDALAHAHAMGIIHRDLKPQNVLITGAPQSMGPTRLVDFGVAHRMMQDDAEPAVDVTHDGHIPLTGTPRYMAPEQIEGQRWRQGPWTDLYALGCLVWQLVCVRGPFDGSLFDMLRAHVQRALPPWTPQIAAPAGLERWVARLLTKQPRQRFQRAADAAHALRTLDTAALRTLAAAPSHKPHADLEATELLELAPGALDTGAPDAGAAPMWAHERPEPMPALVSPIPPTWRLTSDQARRSRAGLGLWGVRALPLIGREVERDVLWALLRQCGRERGVRAVMLEGEAGCGKSRLAQWLLERAHEVGAAEPLHATHSADPGALGGVGPMLARALRVEQLPEEVALADHLLEQYGLLGVSRQDAIFEVMTLASLVGANRRQSAGVPSASRADRLHTAQHLLRLLAAERPLVVWLDDAGWDVETLELTLRLLDEADLPCLLVLTQRDGEPLPPVCAELLGRVRAHGRTQSLTLAPLEAAEQSALLTGGLGLSREVADEVVRLTRGNPLFAVQLMSDWVTRGALELSPEGYVARAGAPLQLPDDLHHVWRLRLEHLLDGEADREHARRSLELAAALGHEVAWHEWRYASQQAGLVLSAGLVDRMVELGLTRRSPRSMAFVHGLLHESVTRTSREAGRWAGLHRICAQMLSAMYPERQPGLMGRLAEHWWQAGDMEAALPALYLAMDHAADMGDYDGVDALLARHARAMDALGLPAEHPHRCRHLGQRGSQHHRRRDHDAGFACQEQAAEIARRHGWGDELALALRRMGLALVSLDKPERAQPLLEEARAIFERRGDADNLLRTLGAMVSACRRRRWRDEAIALMAQLEGLEARLGYTQAAAHAYLDMSFLLSNLGDLDGALRYLEIAQERADRLGSRNMVSWCLNARGDLARLLDDHEQALDAYERALRIDRRYFPAQVPVLMLNVAMLHAERGAWEQALAALPEVERALLARTNHDSFFIHTNLVRLCCGAALERWEIWDQGAAELSHRWPRPDAVYRELALMADRAARLAHAAGDPTRAAYAAQLAREQWHALTSFAEL